jgi:uncharacterized protein (DUF2249 family)
MITADTNLAQLLDAHPGLVEYLAGYHDHFARLRDRMTRRVMALRVTVAQAAALAGVPAVDLVTALRRAVGEPGDEGSVTAAPPAAAVVSPGSRPAELDQLRVVEVDVRDDIRRGEEPFSRIIAAAKALGAGEALVIRAPFEPVPLYDVLGRRGLAHWPERLAQADWRVWFHHATGAPPAGSAPVVADRSPLDVRGLEPPLPMVRVLERLDALEAGGTLTVLHERRPMFLYPQLDARGFVHETDEPEPGLDAS